MRQEITDVHFIDGDGNPAGGFTDGVGIHLSWQNGPLVRDGERLNPTGTFVETVIYAAIKRLEFYQDSKFACKENAEALLRLTQALAALEKRTAGREARGVEGTHQV